MPVDSPNTKNLYIAGAVGIVLVLLIIIQLSRRQVYNYAVTHDIAVKTSQGLIKMNTKMLADKLILINANLQKFKNTSVPVVYSPVIKKAMANLTQFINDNPGVDLCKANIKADIVHQALSDSVTYDEDAQSLAYKTIVETDEVSHLDDKSQFNYFLANLHILIGMLHKEVCTDGMLDLDQLEKLLDFMEKDLEFDGQFDRSIGNETGNEFNRHSLKRMPLFIKEQGQLEGFDSIENYRKAPRKVAGNPNMLLHKKLQDRSEFFRNNDRTLGTGLVSDEELLAGSDFTNYKGYL
jgi:hypothetical protein